MKYLVLICPLLVSKLERKVTQLYSMRMDEFLCCFVHMSLLGFDEHKDLRAEKQMQWLTTLPGERLADIIFNNHGEKIQWGFEFDSKCPIQ